MADIIENISGEGELATVASVESDIKALSTNTLNLFTTLTDAGRESKVETLKAITDAVPLSDAKGEITINNVVIYPIEITNEETGEVVQAPRIILLCDEGNFYAVSHGILSSLKNLFGILGMPGDGDGWPITVMPTEEKTRKGWRVYSLKVVR